MSSDASRDPELFDLIARTYGLVGVADGELADVEVERLTGWARDHGFDGPSVELLEERCRAFVRALESEDSERHRDRLIADLAGLRDGGSRATVVLSAARVAVVADERIDEAEEQVLRDIASALGLDPDIV